MRYAIHRLGPALALVVGCASKPPAVPPAPPETARAGEAAAVAPTEKETPPPPPPPVDHAAVAREILSAAGVKGGLVVHVSCGDGRLTAALRASDSYLVHGLDPDAALVAKARAHAASKGMAGVVSFERLPGARLPYAGNLVNLIIAEDLAGVPMAEVMRVLAPGGVAYAKEGGAWRKTVKPRPDEIDEWTHFLHDASNNAVSRDTVAGPPKSLQWVSGPRWARSHDHLSSLSALVSARGRVFYIVDEGAVASVALPPEWSLVARDAFNGTLLWKRPLESWEGHLRNFRSGPAELARRLVAAGETVYVTLGYGEPVTALDAATGGTIREYPQTANALEIVLCDGTLYVVAGDRPPENADGAAVPQEPGAIWHWWPIYEETPPRKRVVAADAGTGAVLWTKADEEASTLMPTALAAAGGRVFLQNHESVVALDARTGSVQWRAPRPVNRRRPTWSAPTLVVEGGVVLSADRAADAPAPGAPDGGDGPVWVVNSLGGNAPQGAIIAFSAVNGERLWEAPCRECYNAPVDVLVADGLVWSGDLVRSKDPGVTRALDLRTGEPRRERPRDQTFFNIVMSHHRCYRNKATLKWLLLGRDGIEFIDMVTGKGLGHAWVRGACQYGVMPANGLVYAPSHSCACHIESKLNGFNALAPAADADAGARSADEAPRTERGPAFGAVPSPDAAADPADWPTHRHDELRSGRASSIVAPQLVPAWEARVSGGRTSAPVVAGGTVLVSCIDAQEVCALDAESGEERWRFTAGGRVDSPPTYCGGGVIFGSADGWIYCVRASDGALAWRFRAAPEERRIVSYGRVESAWPVHGSVLVRGGVVHAVAGRSGHLDGGMRLCRIEAATGRLLSETRVDGDALPDVLSCDGESVFMRHLRFDLEGARVGAAAPHLYSSVGLLDGDWWHRTYWFVGTRMGSGWGAWPNSGNGAAAGRLLVLDGDAVYGFGRLNQYHRNGSHAGLGHVRYALYSCRLPPQTGAAAPRTGRGKGRTPAAQRASYGWKKALPFFARAMLLSGDTLFAAGPPDVLVASPEEARHAYHRASPPARLKEQAEAFAGRRGGVLRAVAARDGATLAEYRLESPPAFDGMAAAGGRLYIGTVDGRIACLRGAAKE